MINADLVLIHGFWSSPVTWDKLSERLSADSELEGLQVHCFRYESPKLSFPLWWTRVPDYNDIAQSLASYLAAQTRSATAIITHSQGGLILQRFLAWMLNEGRGRDLATIKLIVMLACPNDGSQYLRSIRAMAGFGRHAQARNLKVLDADVADTRRTVLKQIVHASTANERECPIPIYAYAGRTDRIVPRTSAQGSFTYAGTLPGNHFSILDPDLLGSLTVATLKRHLIDTFAANGTGPVAAGAASSEPTVHQPGVQANKADPEKVTQPYLRERISALQAIRTELNQFEEALRNSAFNRTVRLDYMMREQQSVSRETLTAQALGEAERRMTPDRETPDQETNSDEEEQARQLRESLHLAELARGIRLTSRKYSAFLSARENELVEIFISRALEIHEKVQYNAETEGWWAWTLAQPLNASIVANAAQEMIDASAELDNEIVALIKQQRE